MSPLVTCLWILAGVVAACWVTSLLTNEHSWVDRMWSIVPIGYVAVFAAAAGFGDARLDTMLVLVALWGARLTFNFARKGGYARGGEDYRWPVLRGRMPRWRFELFNLFFIAIYQNVLLLLISLPALTAYQNQGGFGAADLLAAAAFVGFLTGETVADQQQWNFQRWKKGQPAPDPRFVQTGLFRYSRHPNFFFEQAQWWVIFAFGAIAAGSVLQWTIVGPVLLTLLFLGSTRFTESISLSRYPEYRRYQQTTSSQIPWFPRPASTDPAAETDPTVERS
jgi:steroid 5-alpha reductase family enzyme